MKTNSEEERDRVTNRLLELAGIDWQTRAEILCLQFYSNIGFVGALFEDARDFCEQQGLYARSSHVWGALCLSLSTKNKIVKTGAYQRSIVLRNRARSQPVWRINR